MKFSLPIVSMVLGAASGTMLFERDLATIQNVLSTVSKAVDSLDSAVKSFSGEPGPLTDASTSLLSALNGGVSTVKGTSSLSQNDALSVASYVQGLNTSVATVVSDLISKKSAIVSAGYGPTVLQQLQQQKTASDSLADAITSKTPEALQSVAKQLTAGIDTSLQSAIDAFTGTSGPSPSGSPSGGSSSASSGPTSVIGAASSTAAGPKVSSTATSGPPAAFTGAAVVNSAPAHVGALFVAVLGMLM
jgi:hypothetical protein